MTDLTTLANVKAWLGDSTSTNDALYNRLIASASDFIRNYTGRDLDQRTYTNIIHDGHNGYRMMFREYPVTAVSSIQVDNVPIPLSTNLSSGYVFDDTFLSLINYRFNRGVANVKMSYTAGYATIPGDLEQACIELVANRFKDKSKIGVASKSMAGETIVFFNKDMPETVKAALSDYRRIALS